MSKPNQLSCSQYVTIPYEMVRDALQADLVGFLRRASNGEISVEPPTLRFRIGALEIGAHIDVSIERFTVVEIAWSGARAPYLFPRMLAKLLIWPLSRTETQLDLLGEYRPPLGVAGKVIDSAVGSDLALESVRTLVNQVVRQLQTELS